jgi:hypothetical protein
LKQFLFTLLLLLGQTLFYPLAPVGCWDKHLFTLVGTNTCSSFLGYLFTLVGTSTCSPFAPVGCWDKHLFTLLGTLVHPFAPVGTNTVVPFCSCWLLGQTLVHPFRDTLVHPSRDKHLFTLVGTNTILPFCSFWDKHCFTTFGRSLFQLLFVFTFTRGQETPVTLYCGLGNANFKYLTTAVISHSAQLS